MPETDNTKLCLKCARARMAGKSVKPCADCVVLNRDPLSQVRANHAQPSPFLRFDLSDLSVVPICGPSTKPARPRTSGRGRNG